MNAARYELSHEPAIEGLDHGLRFACGRCEACGAPDPTRVSSMTAYPWNGEGPNPNRPFMFCEDCRDDYVEYWNEMWRAYHNSRF